jgi:hypothetical protein
MEILFTHKLDLKNISVGLGMDNFSTSMFLDDGRLLGRLAEFIFAEKYQGKKTAENMPYDVTMPNGDKVEIRSITKNLSFASSKEVGYGRSVTMQGFQQKLDVVDYYVVVDYNKESGEMTFIKITKPAILQMERDGVIGKNKSVSRKKILKLIYG